MGTRSVYLEILAAALVAVTIGSGTALAQPVEFEREDAEIFRPTTDNGPFITVYDSIPLRPGQFSVGFYGDYARRPLELQFEGDGDTVARLVDNLGTAQLMGAIGVLPRLQIGARMSGYIIDRSDVSLTGVNLGGGTDGAFGDMLIDGKFTLLDRSESGFGLAIVPQFTLPTGDDDKFAGTGSFGYGGLLVADVQVTPEFTLALNAGGVIRDQPGGGPLKDSDDDFNDQLRFGAAAAYDMSDLITGIVEGYGAADTSDPFDLERKTPFDVIGALRFHLGKIDLTFGGGAGVTNGQGSPEFRIFFGVTPPRPKHEMAPPDLSASRKTYAIQDLDRDGRPSPGDVMEYTVTLVNSGDTPITNLRVTDPVPDHTAYVQGTMMVNGQRVTDEPGDDAGEYNPAPPTVIAMIPQLDGAGSGQNEATVVFRVNVDKNLTTITKVLNQATVSADGLDSYPLPPAEATIFPKVRETEHVIVTPERLELTEEIHFEFDKATIQRQSYPILKELAGVLEQYPALRIRIEGNTDAVGTDSYNQKLSELRALAVRDFLVGAGIDKNRMEWVGRGESAPIATNETAAGRAKNRRTEFIVLNPDALGGKTVETRDSNQDLAPGSEPGWLKSKGPGDLDQR